MKNLRKILIAEDNEIDQINIKSALSDFDNYQIIVAGSYEETKRTLEHEDIYIFITDFYLGDGEAIELLKQIKVNTIFITGSSQLSIAIEALKLGAHDYLVKDFDLFYLKALPVVVKKVERIIQNKLELEIHQSRLRDIIDNTSDLVFFVNCLGDFSFVNPAWICATGYNLDELTRQKINLFEMIEPRVAVQIRGYIADQDFDVHQMEMHIKGKSEPLILKGNMTIRRELHDEISVRCIFSDITKRRKLEAELYHTLRNSSKYSE